MLRPDRGGKGGKIRHELVNIVRIVLNRDQPLLDLAPWRQEDAAVVLEQPVGMAVRIVEAEEAAEVADRLGREDHAALCPDGDHARGEPVSADFSLYPFDGTLAQGRQPAVGLRSRYLAEHRAAGAIARGLPLKVPTIS